MTNKVTHIINCAGKEVKNLWESLGIKYLNFNWKESDKEILFDSAGDNTRLAFSFLNSASDKGESAMVHSLKG